MTEGECQVINLGVGSDTWYWNMVDEQKAPKKAWVEVDFSEVTAKKLYQIKSHKQLLEKIQSPGLHIKSVVKCEFRISSTSIALGPVIHIAVVAQLLAILFLFLIN